MKPIGVIGGMGPEATILLMQKILQAVPATDDADHIPLIVHQNPQVPSRIKALIDGTGRNPAPVLAQMARDLENAGAQALVMPCNTAHHYAPAITETSDLPFLNMLDLTAQALAKANAKGVGILASPATRLAGVFDAPFATHGLAPVTLTDDAEILKIIRAVKAGQIDTEIRQHLTNASSQLLDDGADHLLIACTELSLLTESLPDNAVWTDSLDCLTTAIIDFSCR